MFGFGPSTSGLLFSCVVLKQRAKHHLTAKFRSSTVPLKDNRYAALRTVSTRVLGQRGERHVQGNQHGEGTLGCCRKERKYEGRFCSSGQGELSGQDNLEVLVVSGLRDGGKEGEGEWRLSALHGSGHP